MYQEALPLIRASSHRRPRPSVLLYLLDVAHAQEVYTERSGEGRQRTIGTGIRRRYDAEHEEDTGHRGEVSQGNAGVEQVGAFGDG